MNPRVRNYQTIVARLGALSKAAWQVQAVAQFGGYPFFTVHQVSDPARPTVLLSAGMHGEEPAGVEGALRWLEGSAWKSWAVNWFVMPCINPSGWERNQRRNRQNRDINRHFRRRSRVPEAELIKRLVAGRRFLLSMEFHEDVDASGFYLYEARRHGGFIGDDVIRAVRRVIPINREPLIDGHETSGPGLIRRNLALIQMRRRRLWPMAFHLIRTATDNIFGSETPISAPLHQRARAHVVALQTVLRGLVR